jgi:hypothetical protein
MIKGQVHTLITSYDGIVQNVLSKFESSSFFNKSDLANLMKLQYLDFKSQNSS